MNESRNKMDKAERDAFVEKLTAHGLANLRRAQARYQAEQVGKAEMDALVEKLEARGLENLRRAQAQYQAEQKRRQSETTPPTDPPAK